MSDDCCSSSSSSSDDDGSLYEGSLDDKGSDCGSDNSFTTLSDDEADDDAPGTDDRVTTLDSLQPTKTVSGMAKPIPAKITVNAPESSVGISNVNTSLVTVDTAGEITWELLNVAFDKLVEKSLEEIEDTSSSEVSKDALAVKKALSSAFGKDDSAFAANYLLEFVRHKLSFGRAAVQLLMDDDKLRQGLLEWHQVDLPSLDAGDFEKLFLLHVDPSLFVVGKDKRSRLRDMVNKIRACSERMFAMIQESATEKDRVELQPGEPSNASLYALNGFPYESYATPSFLSFKDRHALHLGYILLRRDKKQVNPNVLAGLLPEGTKEPRSSKRIRLDWETRKARGANRANQPLLLQAATNVARGLNEQAAACGLNTQAIIKPSAPPIERPVQAADLVGGVKMLEERDDMPNNLFINKLLLAFADSYLDRRWRERNEASILRQ